PCSDTSALPVDTVKPSAVDTIEAFVRSTDKDEEQKMRFLQSICTVCDTAVQENKEQDLRIFCRRNKLVENIMELLSEEPRGKLCSELRQQAMAAITALSAVEAVLEDKIPLLTVCFQSILLLPSEQNLDISLYSRVQQIVTAIHRWRKLITENRPKRIIRHALHWLADSDPRAVTLSLLRCSPTCDKDMWELWKIVLSSEDVVPQIVQQLLKLLEMAPLSQETKIGSLPLAATIALHEIVQHEQYGPQLHLYFPELFVALIFQMVSSGVLTPMEVTAVMAGPFCPSAPTSALRIVVEVLHNLLQCAGLEHLAHYMERHGLWGQLLGAATWRDGLCTLARLMVKNYCHQCTPIFSHVHMLLQDHQLHWREVPAMAFYIEMQSCLEFRTNFCPGNIFRKYICSEHPQSQELALRGLRLLNARSMHLLLPDVLTWLQDTRVDVKLQALQLLHNIVAQHPGHLRDKLSQLAVHLLSCFN
ncbi:UNVERIFIED_CONTAM: hypothetical protein H355_012699, partial [Colinus virginianus]